VFAGRDQRRRVQPDVIAEPAVAVGVIPSLRKAKSPAMQGFFIAVLPPYRASGKSKIRQVVVACAYSVPSGP
jgi:hypothetical protein